MFKLLLLVFSVSISLRAVSQQDHFLYLQSDDRQPFYAKLSGQVHSSSENGYLIIPKLADGSYQLDIGFARSAFPEQHFPLTVNKKDLGFQLKNLGEKGWALYNFRNSEMLASSNSVGQKGEEFSGTKKTDNFSSMLASIVNDSAILYSAVTAPPPPKPVAAVAKPDTLASAVVTTASEKDLATLPPAKPEQQIVPARKDSVKSNNTIDSAASIVKADLPTPKKEETVTTPVEEPKQVTAANSTTAKPEPAVSPPVSSTPLNSAPATKEKPFILRINESTSAIAYEAVYLEQYNLSTDTIRIAIPLQESEMAQKPRPEPAKQEPVVQAPTSVAANNEAAVTKLPETPAPKKPGLQIVNSDCKNFATDHDVDKLRVKMMAEYAIEDKLVSAKKIFKTRCFTVKQIRALTELFTSDENRYQFFDAAYPFVSDSSEFQTLESLIIDDYYKNRFKAMVHK